MSETCVCGHDRSEHYEYILNGRPQTRCKACDPHKHRGSGSDIRVMVKGTAESDMYFYADHDFKPQVGEIPMRELTSHRVNGLNEAICISVLDDPGQGNACHKYRMTVFNTEGHPEHQDIEFQNGPIAEFGVNGISNEALLSIVEDRLAGFQSGPFACRENAVALTKLQESMMWLQKRTRDRLARGVEGTNQK